MDFAKKQLEKYGWQEGKGLGKNENGISAALKPNLKFDNAGIGHNVSEQFTNNWWENLYNSASKNVNVNAAVNGNVQLNVNDPEAVEITTKSYSLKNLKKKNNNLEYGSFIKTSKLTEAGIVEFDNNNCCVPETSIPKTERPLTDEELFIACGGRTAHKGARHGLTLNGKLSRLEKQEKLLLKKLRRVSLSDETDNKITKKSLEKKLKKVSDHKNKHKPETMDEDIAVVPSGSQCSLSFSSPHKSSKKRKKERKRVSFSETVTEYQSQDPDANATENQSHDIDSSSQSDASSRPSTPVTTVVRKVKIRDVKENSVNEASLVPDQDEGIDCSDFDCKEKDASDLQAKIREDNQKMKRKLKKLRRKCTHSETELIELPKEPFKVEGENSSVNTPEKCVKCIKRKIEQDQEDCEIVKIKKCHYKVVDKELDGVSSNCKNMPGLTKKQLKRQWKKERRLEKRINKVADSLNQFCKISDIESE